tara:strand:- start:1381 stop:3084 length:1704 start_codon:yes stop_codon:yes gene_type:complete
MAEKLIMEEVSDKSSDTIYEVDLSIFFRSLVRNKVIIFFIIFLSGITGIIYSFSQKKIWQGDFQIVLDTGKNSQPTPNLTSITSGLGTQNIFRNLIKGNTNLNTEIEILKSPSTLMPIFEFIKEEKQKKGEKPGPTRFNNWIDKKLKIKLKKATTVLNVSYRDSDKELISEVLNRVSNLYQKYSSVKKVNDINNSIDFVKKEISKYEETALNSYKKSQNYAEKYDLQDLNINNQVKKEFAGRMNTISMPIKKSTSINSRLRETNYLIDYLQNLENDSDLLGSTIYIIPENKLTLGIEELNLKISKYKSILKSDDKELEKLINNRDMLLISFKDSAIAYLKGEREKMMAEKESIDRSPEIITQFKALNQEAIRDELTLSSLENELRFLLLEKSRSPKNWKLITKPTLLDYPVEPKKKKITFLITFVGTFLGVFIIFIKERLSGIAYDKEEIKSRFNLKEIAELNQKNNLQAENIIKELSKDFIEGDKTKSLIINLCNFENNFANHMLEKIKEYSTDNILIEKNDIFSIKNKSIIFMLESGYSKKKDIKNILNYLRIKKLFIEGFLFIQ